ncbi:hypothetical protein QJS10_CPB21g00237 [Acorus calamus]|uniref:Uncharacterized protein n=1 Tax=Acorus calamus TaxID=4465 RepID=A0AAV9C5V3_ACOCL|nr:hypothetical protein QJS10_CPB21g00237 [Acorus calamus]
MAALEQHLVLMCVEGGTSARVAAHTDTLNINIDHPIEDGDTALHLCCLYGHLSCVQLLLERGASLESKDEEGALPIHDACAGGFIQIVQFLIDAAKTPEKVRHMLDTTDSEGETTPAELSDLGTEVRGVLEAAAVEATSPDSSDSK